jgi:chemotaxis protein methyltransferase CheR
VNKTIEQDKAENIEIKLLLEGVYEQYGYDFREYSSESLRRRIRELIRHEGLTSVSVLQNELLRNPDFMDRLVLQLSVNITSMFRDPEYFASIRNKIIPRLRTYPFIRIWIAGCGSGEEVYSLAILLEEEGLLSHSRIYATDINDVVLKQAKEGIYPIGKMQEYSTNYQKSGGSRSFSEFYTANYDRAVFRQSLKEHIVFAQHNLVTDGPFNTFNLVLCRNVLIYFNDALTERVLRLLQTSVEMFGFLGLGVKESLQFTQVEKDFEVVDSTNKLYKKIR